MTDDSHNSESYTDITPTLDDGATVATWEVVIRGETVSAGVITTSGQMIERHGSLDGDELRNKLAIMTAALLGVAAQLMACRNAWIRPGNEKLPPMRTQRFGTTPAGERH